MSTWSSRKRPCDTNDNDPHIAKRSRTTDEDDATDDEEAYSPYSPTFSPATPSFFSPSTVESDDDSITEEDFAQLLYGDLQGTDAEDVEAAIDDLQDLFKDHGDNLKTLQSFEAIQGLGVLVTTLKRWTHNASVVESLLSCLSNFAFCLGKNDKYNIDKGRASLKFVTMGGLEIVVSQIMERFPDDPVVLRRAMALISNFLCPDAIEWERFAVRFVIDYKGLPLIWKAMNDHPKNEKLQDHACWLLATLCQTGMSGCIASEGTAALASVAGAIHSFPDNPDIVHDALLVLKAFES